MIITKQTYFFNDGINKKEKMSPLKSIKNDKISKVFSEEPGNTRIESLCQVRKASAGHPVFEGIRKCTPIYATTSDTVTENVETYLYIQGRNQETKDR